MNIRSLVEQLEQVSEDIRGGFEFSYQIIPGDEEVLQITITDREEIPIFLTLTDTQILCIAYLWGENEVKPESRTELTEVMLEMNIPMPLSSFSKIGDKYTIFGALSLNSSIEDIVHEIVILSDNSIDAIEVMSEFLK